MASSFNQKWQIVHLSSEISLSKKIGDKTTYRKLSQTSQKWDFGAFGMNFLV